MCCSARDRFSLGHLLRQSQPRTHACTVTMALILTLPWRRSSSCFTISLKEEERGDNIVWKVIWFCPQKSLILLRKRMRACAYTHICQPHAHGNARTYREKIHRYCQKNKYMRETNKQTTTKALPVEDKSFSQSPGPNHELSFAPVHFPQERF